VQAIRDGQPDWHVCTWMSPFAEGTPRNPELCELGQGRQIVDFRRTVGTPGGGARGIAASFLAPGPARLLTWCDLAIWCRWSGRRQVRLLLRASRRRLQQAVEGSRAQAAHPGHRCRRLRCNPDKSATPIRIGVSRQLTASPPIRQRQVGWPRVGRTIETPWRARRRCRRRYSSS
jgi:hypothetical protein